MFGYIYKTTIKNKNSKLFDHFYIGQKQSPIIVESYYGSGKKLRDYFNSYCDRKWSRKIHKDEVEKLGLTREILATAENINELNELEEYYVNKELDNPLCINLMTGGYGRIVNREVIDQMTQKKLDSHMHWWTNGEKVIMSAESPGEDFRPGRSLNKYSWFNNGIRNVYAQKCPDDNFKPGKISTNIGRPAWNKGIKYGEEYIKKDGACITYNPKSWNKGLTKKTDERIRKMSKKRSITNKGRHFSPKTEWKKGHKNWNTGLKGKGICKPNSGSFNGDEYRGTKWYNNGIKNIRALIKPEGDEWMEGMLSKTKKINSSNK